MALWLKKHFVEHSIDGCGSNRQETYYLRVETNRYVWLESVHFVTSYIYLTGIEPFSGADFDIWSGVTGFCRRALRPNLEILGGVLCGQLVSSVHPNSSKLSYLHLMSKPSLIEQRGSERRTQPKGWVGELRANQILRLKLPLVDPKKTTNLSLCKVWESFSTTFLELI